MHFQTASAAERDDVDGGAVWQGAVCPTSMPGAPAQSISSVNADRDGHEDPTGLPSRVPGSNNHCGGCIQSRLVEVGIERLTTFLSPTVPSALTTHSIRTSPCNFVLLRAFGVVAA